MDGDLVGAVGVLVLGLGWMSLEVDGDGWKLVVQGYGMRRGYVWCLCYFTFSVRDWVVCLILLV